MKYDEQTKAGLRRQLELQVKVCERAEKEIKGLREHKSRSSLLMDLESVPELDLDKLLYAPKYDFAHDICGIIRHMDRSSYPGKLTDFFWPRCASQSAYTNTDSDVEQTQGSFNRTS